jgi:hypothetical protein
MDDEQTWCEIVFIEGHGVIELIPGHDQKVGLQNHFRGWSSIDS